MRVLSCEKLIHERRRKVLVESYILPRSSKDCEHHSRMPNALTISFSPSVAKETSHSIPRIDSIPSVVPLFWPILALLLKAFVPPPKAFASFVDVGHCIPPPSNFRRHSGPCVPLETTDIDLCRESSKIYCRHSMECPSLRSALYAKH